MKRWFYERFLPMWAKETLLKDYRLLRRENTRLRRKLEQREAYMQGMEKGFSRMQNAKRTTQRDKIAGGNLP